MNASREGNNRILSDDADEHAGKASPLARRLRRLRVGLLMAACIVVPAYVAVFTIWWQRCERELYDVPEGSFQVVITDSEELPFDSQILATPAFFFLTKVCGYEPIGFAVGAESDQLFWIRNPPKELLHRSGSE